MIFTISSLCIKEPAHLTKYSFALGLDYVKSNNSYHGQFTGYNLKLFIHKEFDQCGSLLRKIMLEGEMYHLLTQLPLTVEEKNNLVVYSRSFLPVWYRAGVVCTQCLVIFGTYSVGLILGTVLTFFMD